MMELFKMEIIKLSKTEGGLKAYTTQAINLVDAMEIHHEIVVTVLDELLYAGVSKDVVKTMLQKVIADTKASLTNEDNKDIDSK